MTESPCFFLSFTKLFVEHVQVLDRLLSPGFTMVNKTDRTPALGGTCAMELDQTVAYLGTRYEEEREL